MQDSRSRSKWLMVVAIAALVVVQAFPVFAGKKDGKKQDEEKKWTVEYRNKKTEKSVQSLEKTSLDVFEKFVDGITKKGLHPKTAAEAAGDTNYKSLKGNQFQIRLGGKDRATFILDDKAKKVTIVDVGGHT